MAYSQRSHRWLYRSCILPNTQGKEDRVQEVRFIIAVRTDGTDWLARFF